MMQPKILIVEDQQDIADDVLSALRKSKGETSEIVHCSNIADAQQHFCVDAPDILIVDINLPLARGEDPEDGSGMQLVAAIRKTKKRVIVILITGETRLSAQDDYLNKGMGEGINEIILKESSINFVEMLVNRVSYLVELLVKLRSNIGNEPGQDILTFQLSDYVFEYFVGQLHSQHFSSVTSVDEAVGLCTEKFVNTCVVSVDNNEGYVFIRRFFAARQDIPVVAVTTLDSVEGFERVKRAIREGAVFGARFNESDNNCVKVLSNAIEQRKEKLSRYKNIIGSHPVMLNTLGLAGIAAENNEPVLIVGDSGTGKELFAMCINDMSARSGKYVNVNCAALPHDLLESELFGHERGAFTGALNAKSGLFEQADGGVIFLDEITELPLDLQAKLLKAIEYMTIRRVGGTKTIHLNVKVILATNRDIASMVEAGEFRNDLYQRIKAFTIHIPALAQRRSDIPRIAYYYIDLISNREAKDVIGIDETAMRLLCEHDWSKGNVRELKNTLEKIIACIPRGRVLIEADDVNAALELDRTMEHMPDFQLYKILSLKEVEKWAGFQHCVACLKKILRDNNAYHIGEKERSQLKKLLAINSDAKFYACIDDGISAARKIAAAKNPYVSEHEILGLIKIGENRAVENFIRGRINRNVTSAPA